LAVEFARSGEYAAGVYAAGVYAAIAITPGEGNGLQYPPEVLRASLPLWEGAHVFVDHAGPSDLGRPGGRSIRDLAGVFHAVQWDEAAQAVRGRLRLLKRHEWLIGLIDECLALRRSGGPAPKIGLSADLYIERRGSAVERIAQVYSLDIVMNPARGGEIESALAVGQASTPDEGVLGESERQARTPAPQIERSDMSEETTTIASRVRLGDPAELHQQACAALLEARLAGSRLPAPLQEELRARLAGRVYAVEELEAELTRANRLHSQLAEAGVIRHLGRAQVQSMSAPTDRLQLALERLLGLKIPDSASDTPRLSGIRELYLLTTGDQEMTGRFQAERVGLANVNTTIMTSIVKNALNKALLQAFEMRPFWWKSIVWEEDFATLNDVTWITAGGIGDLPTVSEGAAYSELSSPTDIEETSAFIKKGGYVGITLETIDRDDVALLRAIPRKLGLAANRTLSAAIAAIFTANAGVGPTLAQDNKALFHTDHGNLGSAALDATSWDACVQAMYKQAEAGSSERLGVRPASLIVPIELENTARGLMDSSEFVGGGSAIPAHNPRYRSAGVVVCPEFGDAGDWAAVANPAECPGVCVGYRYGRAPELFIAEDPLSGGMFTNDAMRIKVRFYYTVGVGEYRALYKANVT
jgi:hypothetical protein